MRRTTRDLDRLQKISLSLMAVMVFITFVAANLHTVFWQSSEWLVSTVLPSVVVDLTNEERAVEAAAPLSRNATLDEAARLKAEHMAEYEYFAHYSPEGISPWHWFDEAGYVYAHAGENLAIHFTDSTEVVEAWMDSPTHRDNIVDPKYTEIGVGTARGEYEGYDTVYVVQLFGAPAYVPPTPVEADPPTAPTAPALETAEPATAPVPEPDPVPVSSSAVAAETNDRSSEQSVSAAPASTPVASPAEPVPAPQPTPAPESVPHERSLTAELTPEPPRPAAPVPNEVVVLQSPLFATSSGLAVAQVTTQSADHAGATVASLATQPNRLLEIVYVTLGLIVVFLLSTSVLLEARRLHVAQAAYGVALLVAMGTLWFVHAWLTSGAVIV